MLGSSGHCWIKSTDISFLHCKNKKRVLVIYALIDCIYFHFDTLVIFKFKTVYLHSLYEYNNKHTTCHTMFFIARVDRLDSLEGSFVEH
jgi:hypothetical protein